MCSHRRAILHLSAKFRSNQTIVGGVITLYPFFKMAAGSHIGFDLGMLDHPRSAIAGLRLILKFSLDPIYSFKDIATFIFYSRPILGSFGGQDSQKVRRW